MPYLPRETKVDVSKFHACHAKNQNAATHRQVPRLPRKKPQRPRRPLRTERATRASPVPSPAM